MNAANQSDSTPEASPAQLSHLAGTGSGRHAAMVDVGHKAESARSATARARIRFPEGLLAQALAEAGPKGPIEEVARIAGILGAKRTSDLIPMCHGLSLDHVALQFEALSEDLLEVRCQATCRAATGVEMEAMCGASIAALTVYDMVKGLSHAIRIEGVELIEKRGGKSGTWRAQGANVAEVGD